jgi:hypothetical protein
VSPLITPSFEDWRGADARGRLIILRAACDRFILTTDAEAACMTWPEVCAFIAEDYASAPPLPEGEAP